MSFHGIRNFHGGLPNFQAGRGVQNFQQQAPIGANNFNNRPGLLNFTPPQLTQGRGMSLIQQNPPGLGTFQSDSNIPNRGGFQHNANLGGMQNNPKPSFPNNQTPNFPSNQIPNFMNSQNPNFQISKNFQGNQNPNFGSSDNSTLSEQSFHNPSADMHRNNNFSEQKGNSEKNNANPSFSKRYYDAEQDTQKVKGNYSANLETFNKQNEEEEYISTNFQDYIDEDKGHNEQQAKDRNSRGDRERRRDERDQRDDRRGRYDRDYDRSDRRDSYKERKDRDREREKERDRSRDGDRSRERDSYRDSDRDRSRSRSDVYKQSRYDDDSQGSKSGDGRSDYRHSRRQLEENKAEEPSATILLRGLPSAITEKEIKDELTTFGAPIKDLRLMRRKETGASRGFAFVEFQNLQDARRWMEHNQGHLYMLNQYQVGMFYSTPKDKVENTGGSSSSEYDPMRGDWVCSKCGIHNFKRRDFCFKCNNSREESAKADLHDGQDQVGINPCNTLILRGLDALTTEDTIQAALNKVTALSINNVLVIRDQLTSVSKGYAFVEMGSVKESSQLVEMLKVKTDPLEVDGKLVLVNYAKNTYTTIMTSYNAAYDSGDYSQYYNQGYGSYYDQSSQQYYDYSSYYGYDQAETQADTVNAAAAVAQNAIEQAKAAKQQSQAHHSVTAADYHGQQYGYDKEQILPPPPGTTSEPQAQQTQLQEYVKYSPPDVSTYQYDETSGYYYDPLTTLYYDANSQYYFDATTGQFMYWDGEQSTYLPAPGNNDGEPTGQGPAFKEPKDKKEKVKLAKKIAKDMEKWAKSMNAQKDSAKEKERRAAMASGSRKESAAADAGFSILEKSKKEDLSLMPPPPLMSKPAAPSNQQKDSSSALVGDYGGDSDSEEETEQSQTMGVVDENKYLDYDKLACLLCKRQFPNQEALQRHQQLSDLHKQNLTNMLKAKAAAEPQPGQSGYRDRAKERRQKYGSSVPLPTKKQKYAPPPIYEEPTKAGIGQDNVGNRMLQKMGWSEGQGLGKKQQGIVDPIMAQRRALGAGLGARGSNYGADAGDTYKDTVRKMMAARYSELE